MALMLTPGHATKATLGSSRRKVQPVSLGKLLLVSPLGTKRPRKQRDGPAIGGELQGGRTLHTKFQGSNGRFSIQGVGVPLFIPI